MEGQEIARLRQALYELMLYCLDVKTGWTEISEIRNARNVLGDTEIEQIRLRIGYEWPWEKDNEDQ